MIGRTAATALGSTATALLNSPLMGDFAPGDVGNDPNFNSLADDPNYIAICVKVSEGIGYSTNSPATGNWLSKKWASARDCWRACQYGKTKFRGGYHYLICASAGQDGRKFGAAQFDYYNSIIASVGGWGDGDMWPTWDLENGDQPANVSNQSIIDTGSGFSERATQVLGRMVMRYSGSFVRDRGIVDKMGASILWVAEYGAPGKPAKLDPIVYTAQGYSLLDTLWWQYIGNTSNGLPPPGYPGAAPCGAGGAQARADINAGIINGGSNRDATIQWILRNLNATTIQHLSDGDSLVDYVTGPYR